MEAEVRTRLESAPEPLEEPLYPPIGDYAVVGDCRTAALVSSRGAIDWLCLPHFSGPAIFAALLDQRRGGCFTVCPTGRFTTRRAYIGGTPVLETFFRTETGVLKLTDFMSIGGDERDSHTLHPQREFLRCLEVIEGEVEVQVRYAPRPRYGKLTPRLRARGALGWACVDGAALYMLHADIPLEPSADHSELHGRFRLRAGDKRYLSFVYMRADIGVFAPLGETAALRLRATQKWWRCWSGGCCYQGPYRDPVLRSALTLKLMTYGLSGAVVAAPTTSLPETIGGPRNWDYRYCWLRDASLTLCAFMDLGFQAEGSAFLGWLLHATQLSRPKLQVLYDVYGETEIPESTLDHLEGYRGSRPVRIGNGAHDQLQLDVYGSVVLAAFDFVERGGKLEHDERRLLRGLGETVCKLWRLPDHGIWENRDTRQRTYSKVMCWVALDRLLRLQERGTLQVPMEKFRKERDAIADAIETQGYNKELGAYSASFGDPIPDASLLLMARYGYRPARDPRMRATFECIDRALGHGALLYRVPPGSDGIAASEGAFMIVSFWAVDYLVRCGERAAAQTRFEQLLEYANDVGLYGEEADPQSGEVLGNYPQAFSHVGLITAALTLAKGSAS